MPSWAIQVVEQSPSRLVIAEPAPAWIGGPVLGIGLILVVVAIFKPGAFLMSPMAARVVRGVLALAAMPFLLLGWGILKSDWQATLDRPSGLLTVERRTFGARRSAEFRLAEIDRATVEAGRASRRVVVMLKSGAAVRVTGYSNRQGHYGVAKAINDFLGRPPSR